MTTPDRPTGHDLAVQAFRTAKANARTRPTKTKKPIRSVPRGDGRDPIGLGPVLRQLATAHDWKTSITGGDLTARWTELCPAELADKVTPARYEPDTGRLHLLPASHTYATQLRLLGGQLAKHLNGKLGTEAVRSVIVLAPGSGTAAAPAAVRPAPVAEQPTAEPQPPHPAYAAALEAIRTAQQERTAAETADQELRDRHFAGHRHVLREPDPAFTDAVTALETARRAQEQDAVRRAAIAAARAQKTGRAPAVRRAFGGAA